MKTTKNEIHGLVLAPRFWFSEPKKNEAKKKHYGYFVLKMDSNKIHNINDNSKLWKLHGYGRYSN